MGLLDWLFGPAADPNVWFGGIGVLIAIIFLFSFAALIMLGYPKIASMKIKASLIIVLIFCAMALVMGWL
jgi:hypothetical protein